MKGSLDRKRSLSIKLFTSLFLIIESVMERSVPLVFDTSNYREIGLPVFVLSGLLLSYEGLSSVKTIAVPD